MLHDCGLNIEHYESTQNKYYYDGQTFDLAELKVLVDAISASKFITQRKCDELITKLLTLTTVDNARKLRRHIYVENRVKPDNQNGYYVVDAINEAIDTRRKISFFYTDSMAGLVPADTVATPEDLIPAFSWQKMADRIASKGEDIVVTDGFLAEGSS